MVQKDINKKNKKLSIAELNKQNKKLDKVREFTVVVKDKETKEEVEYDVTHDIIFRKTKQHLLLDNMVDFFNAGSERIELLNMATPYTALLILKHFTSLEVPDDIDEAVVLLKVLIDLDVLDAVLAELPEEETTKVFELLTQTVEGFKATLEGADKEAKEDAENLLEQIDNDVLKQMVIGEEVDLEEYEVEEDGEVDGESDTDIEGE